MHPANRDCLAAIRLTVPASVASATGKIWYQCDNIPGPECFIATIVNDFTGQLMSKNAWIVEERLCALEPVQVGATDAHTTNAENRHARYGFWLCHFRKGNLMG